MKKQQKTNCFTLILLAMLAFLAVVGLVLLFKESQDPIVICLESWGEKIATDYGCEITSGEITSGIGYAEFECQFDDGLVFTFRNPKSVIKECGIGVSE